MVVIDSERDRCMDVVVVVVIGSGGNGERERERVCMCVCACMRACMCACMCMRACVCEHILQKNTKKKTLDMWHTFMNSSLCLPHQHQSQLMSKLQTSMTSVISVHFKRIHSKGNCSKAFPSKVFASMVCNLSTYQCDLFAYHCGLSTYQCGLSTYQCGLSTYHCGLVTYQCGLSKYEVCSNVLSSHGWVANWPTAAMKWGKTKSTTGGTERDSKPFLSISLMFITTPFLSISLPDITILANCA